MLKSNHNSSTTILGCYFFLGAFSLIIQTILLREFLFISQGYELIFGISLTLWLTGVFAGALLAGKISSRVTTPLLHFVLSILVIVLAAPVLISLIRLLNHIAGTPTGSIINLFKASFYSALIIIPFSFAIGYSFPFAAKINIKGNRQNTKPVTKVYIFEAAGALSGGVIYSFLLVGRFNQFFIIGLAALPLMISLLLLVSRNKSRLLHIITALSLILNLALLLPKVNDKIDSRLIMCRWQKISGSQLLTSEETKFQNLIFAKNYGQVSIYSNGKFQTSFPEESDNKILAAHLICQHKNPGRILVIGECLTGLAKHLLNYRLEELVCIEMDQKFIELIERHLPESGKEILNDKRFKLKIGDSKRFLTSRKKMIARNTALRPFDIIYLNLSDPASLMTNRYYTREFFKLTSDVLDKQGVLALQVTSSENYTQGIIADYTVSVFNTLREVFPYIVIAPGPKNFFFASGSQYNITDSAKILQLRYRKTGLKPERLGLIFKSIYPIERTRFIKTSLQNHQNKAINTIKNPTSLFYYNMLMGWYAQSNLKGIFQLAKVITPFTMLLVMSIFIIIRLLSRTNNFFSTARDLKVNIIYVMVAGGMVGISTELLLVYSFQSLSGFIYHMIGFIIAVFMAGLPLGAMLANRQMDKYKQNIGNQLKSVILLQVISALLVFLFMLFSSSASGIYFYHKLIFYLLALSFGILTGAIFTYSLSLYNFHKNDPGKTAGIIDAADHFGAALGAFLIGTILIPVLGFEKCATLLILLSLFGSVLLTFNYFALKKR